MDEAEISGRHWNGGVDAPRTSLPSPKKSGGNGGGAFRTALPSPKKGWGNGGEAAVFPSTTPPMPKTNRVGGAFPSTTPPMPKTKRSGASPQSSNDSSSAGESATPPTHRENGRRNGESPLQKAKGWTSSPNSSPHVARRLEPAMPATSHTHRLTLLICNSLWGQKLTFHPFTMGDKPVMFSCLWPDQDTLVDTYKDAELNKRPYDLCKLLLAGQCVKALEALLNQKVLPMDAVFGSGCGSLLHLACALGHSDTIQSLLRRSQPNIKIWSIKDDEGLLPVEVCARPELRRALPPNYFLSKKKVVTFSAPTEQDKKRIFELATRPDNFYNLINALNCHPTFDFNNERNHEGDLLIHVAIKGGLPQLPLLFALVNFYRADIRLKDGSGTTPLGVAIKCGEQTLAELLVCVFGVDINQGSTAHQVTPLHMAVSFSHPRIINMLLKRGADALKEDRNGCVPSFLARKQRAAECRQIINQFLKEHTEQLCQDTINGTLNVKRLYKSDLCLVNSSGLTLLMLAAAHNQEVVLRNILKRTDCPDLPLDFRQMKSCDQLDSLNTSLETSWCESQKDKDHTLKTAVHIAAEKGNLTCLQALLDANAHPSLADSTGWLPLHYAVDRGYIECVKTILAYPNFLGLAGLKPALDISRENQFDEITKLLESARERRQRELITPLLFEVVQSGDKDQLQRNKEQLIHMLQNGDNVNPLNESHDWPLLLAAGFGYDDVVAQLYEFGGHVTKRHRISRSTPLHVAARGGHTKVVRYLLQFCPRGVENKTTSPFPSGVMDDDDAQFLDINGKNMAGATPLELAASQGHTEVVKLLLERGASTTIPDSNGRILSCSSFAGTQFLLETHRKERCRAIIDALRNQSQLKNFRRSWLGPSDFNLHDSHGNNMLMVAAQYAQPEVLEFLLKQAAVIKQAMLISSDQSPLMLSTLMSTRSEDSSDTSLAAHGHSRHKSDSHVTSSLTVVSKPYDPDMEESGRRTALPSVFRGRHGTWEDPGQGQGGRREAGFTASGRHLPEKPPRIRGKPLPAHQRSSTSSQVSSSEEDEPGRLGPVGVVPPLGSSPDDGGVTDSELPEPFERLIRFRNPHDGQTCLHRASGAGQHRNVVLLLKKDMQLANQQDNDGNTALHLACNKASKQTVQALLGFECVMTTLRNNQNELPEQHCLKSAIKKLVCKARQKRAGRELGFPDPPKGISASMEKTNGQLPSGVGGQQLPDIPEMVSAGSSISADLSLTYFTSKLDRLKSDMKAMPPDQQDRQNESN